MRVLRYKTEGDLKTFKNFYKNIGGEIENPTRNEILADSVLVKKLKLSEILDLLVLEKCETKCEVRDVDRIAGALMKDFEKKFGDQLTRDQHVIIRYYLAVKTEVEELRKNATMADINKIADRIVAAIPINISFKITAERGLHCVSTRPGGEFDIGQSWILEVQGGKLTSHFGSVQGMTKCMQCGCWHAGSQCPYCDLGYAATC